MSIAISSLVWANGPTGSRAARANKAMLLALADRCNDRGGSCFPGMNELAARCGVGRRAAIDTIARLEVEGWITVIRHGDGRRSNNYQLVLSRLGTLPVSHHQGVQSTSPGGAVDDTSGVQSTTPELSYEPPSESPWGVDPPPTYVPEGWELQESRPQDENPWRRDAL